MPEQRGSIDPDEVIKEMNKLFSAGFTKNKFRVVRSAPHPKYPLQVQKEFFAKEDFINRVSNPKIEMSVTKGKKTVMEQVSRGKFWLDSERRTEHDAIAFQPAAPEVTITKDKDGRPYRTLNTFSRFACIPDFDDSESKCGLFLEHLYFNICGGNDGLYEYVLDWMASGVQHPGNPGRTALSMRGVPGAGKGAFAQYYGRIFGQHFLHATQRDHVTGKFNGHQAGKLVIFVDEALYAEFAADAQILKTMITEKTKLMELKGIDAIPVDNFARYIFATNAEHPLRIEFNDRRYVAIYVIEPACYRDEPDPVLKKEKAKLYFDALFYEMENGGAAALLGLLLKRDIKSWNAEAIPETAERKEQQLLSAPPRRSGHHQHRAGCQPAGRYPRPTVARPLAREIPEQPRGLFDAMKQASPALARLTDHKLARILRDWKFNTKHLEDGRAWEAPYLVDLRAAILAKYPAVEFDEEIDWGGSADMLGSAPSSFNPADPNGLAKATAKYNIARIAETEPQHAAVRAAIARHADAPQPEVRELAARQAAKAEEIRQARAAAQEIMGRPDSGPVHEIDALVSQFRPKPD
jgi:hypothetical protein